jgi:hypothetical protein
MPKKATKTATKSSDEAKSRTKQKTPLQLNNLLKNEIARLSNIHGIEASILEDFAYLVIERHKEKDPIIKPLALSKIKEEIYKHFSVKNTPELKKSGAFKMATDGMNGLNLSVKDGWEKLYRKFIGILPGEENQQGYGCINGINIFNYFKPWQVFGLNPQSATTQDIKEAYYRLSKIYHPDNHQTGDSNIFENLTVMYKSICAEA